MPIQYKTPAIALGGASDRVLLDVRTPAEFAESRIPGALNLPLFSDAERVVVGTLYKQVGPEAALLKGLEMVGPKLRGLVETARDLAPDRRVCLHCWRGGQRSGSVAWLLDTAGFDVVVLQGGYKAYRHWTRAQLEQPRAQLLVVGGPTGSGKTEILHALHGAGEQIIDLEALAHHKGSSFGALGERPQPSIPQFENQLSAAWQQTDDTRRVWIENESRSIGRVYLPSTFYEQLSQAPMFDLNVPLESRLRRLVGMYAPYSSEHLAAAFTRIGKRLGGQHLKAAMAALAAEDYHEAARIALVYYDKAYERSDLQQRKGRVIPFPVAEDNPEKTAAALVAFADAHLFV